MRRLLGHTVHWSASLGRAHQTRYIACRASSSQSVQHITSTANSFVKHCGKLRTSSKYRAEQSRVLLCGLTLLEEIAEGSGGKLHARTLVLSQDLDPARAPAWLSADSMVTVTEAVMKKLSGLENVQNMTVVAELDLPPPADFLAWGTHPQQASSSSSRHAPAPVVEAPPDSNAGASSSGRGSSDDGLRSKQQRAVKGRPLCKLLALDGVQDPGNLGTLVRSALAFGFEGVFLLPGCVDPYNDKAVRASRGACLRMPWAEGDLAGLQQVAAAHGLALIAAEPELDAAGSKGRGSKAPAQGVCVVLGAEGQGVSKQVLAVCTPVAIPMVGGPSGQMESLNVSVAGSILMFMLSDAAPERLLGRLGSLGLRPALDRGVQL